MVSPRFGSLGKSAAATRKSRLSIRIVEPYSFSVRNSVLPNVAGISKDPPVFGLYVIEIKKHSQRCSFSHSDALFSRSNYTAT
nr:MAG TPA: hypothetical protein [Caudoviricetes sp.]